MARRVNKLVDIMKHNESGMTVELFLTPENTFASQQVLGTVIEDASMPGLKSKLSKFLDENFTLEFVPVIKIETPDNAFADPQQSKISLRTSRMLLARNQVGKFFYLDWRDRDETPQRKMLFSRNFWRRGLEGKEMKFPLRVDGEYYIPYTEETWAALMELHSIIKKARQRLENMLESDDLEHRLILVGKAVRLLPESLGDENEQ